jgi:alpha-tubulin suppressor-like RCC1 family protein
MKVIAYGNNFLRNCFEINTTKMNKEHEIVELTGINIKEIKSGNEHSLILTENNELYGMGSNRVK